MKDKSKSVIMTILIVIVLMYVGGHIVAGLLFTDPMLFIYIIAAGFVITAFGLIKIPFDLFKWINRKRR